ncbi:MAG: prepilin-type N-terminal cleavage/methylation domain-containing protein [Pseudomonadota bacterium]
MPVNKPSTQDGFTLIEITIAVILVAVGIAGNFKLFEHSFRQHSFGQQLARASELGLGLHGALIAAHSLDPTINQRCRDGEQAACDAQTWRLVTVQQWQQRAARVLPNGRIVVQPSGSLQHRITVSWKDPVSLTRDHWAMDVSND